MQMAIPLFILERRPCFLLDQKAQLITAAVSCHFFHLELTTRTFLPSSYLCFTSIPNDSEYTISLIWMVLWLHILSSKHKKPSRLAVAFALTKLGMTHGNKPASSHRQSFTAMASFKSVQLLALAPKDRITGRLRMLLNRIHPHYLYSNGSGQVSSGLRLTILHVCQSEWCTHWNCMALVCSRPNVTLIFVGSFGHCCCLTAYFQQIACAYSYKTYSEFIQSFMCQIFIERIFRIILLISICFMSPFFFLFISLLLLFILL